MTEDKDIDEVLDNDPFAEEEAENQSETDEATTEKDEREDDSVPKQSVPSDSAESEEGEIGHVLASEEIRVGRGDYNVNGFVTTGNRDDVQVGDYVQIPYPDSDDELFSIVDALRYEPYTELDDKSDTHNLIAKQHELDESEFVLVGELDPLAIITDEDGELDRGIVNQIPKPNSPVTLSRDEDYLRTGLNIPGEGIFAGHLAVGGEPIEINDEPFPYYIHNPGIDPQTGEPEDGEPTVFRHTLVAGSTGAGKTHYTKNLLRQYVSGKRYPVEVGEDEIERSRLNIVVFDPENEYWEMREDNPDLTQDQIQTLRQQDIEFGGVDDLEVFVPEVEYTTKPATGGQTPLTIPFSVVEEEPQLLMPYHQMTDVTQGAIEDCIESYFESFKNNSSWSPRPVEAPKYDDFVAFLNENDDSDSRLRQVHEIGDGTWSAVRKRVIDENYRAVFDGGVNPFPEISEQLFREGQVTVIPTSHLTGEKEYLVVLALLSYILKNKINDYKVDTAVKRTPILVAVDEAHNYLSSPNNIREQYIVGRARAAAKQGRKYNLGLTMVTQNPQDIDDEILKQTNTNVFLYLKSNVVEDTTIIPNGYKNDIPNYSKGQAVIRAPDVETVEVCGLPYCLTRHDS